MLSADVDRYLRLRRALGYKLARTERHLRAYARRHDEHGGAHLNSVFLTEWVAADGQTASARNDRLRILARFARLLHAEDPRHEVPPANIFGSPRTRPTPYTNSRRA